MNKLSTLSLALIAATSLFSISTLASECVSKVERDSAGNYQGCMVHLDGKEFRLGAEGSSEGGCSQACAIMGAVQNAKKGGRIATAMYE
jgi:K+-transporting ATPase A subunit